MCYIDFLSTLTMGILLQILSIALVVHSGLSNRKDFSPLSHLVGAFWLAVSIPIIETVDDSCWGLKCYPVGDKMYFSKCLVAFGVFLQIWHVMDINDTKTIKNKQTKELPGFVTLSLAVRSCRQSKRRWQESAGVSQKSLQTASICGPKTFWPEITPSFLIAPNGFFFQELGWFLSELCKLRQPPTNCCETSAFIVWENLPFLPCSICHLLRVANTLRQCSLLPFFILFKTSCTQFPPSHPQLFIFRANGCSFFCNIFSHLYLPWKGGPELCILFWFAIAFSGLISAHWNWVC